jgi:hypothetical protein
MSDDSAMSDTSVVETPSTGESDYGSPQEEPEQSEPSKETPEAEPQLTDKGTKLDPNPQSAVHQELANERRKIQQYEKVLSDPDMLKRYAKEAGITLTEAKAEIKEELYSADKFKTADDIANALNELKTGFNTKTQTYEEQIKKQEAEIASLRGERTVEKIASTMKSDIDTVREKYPELDPKSPNFNKELEESIGQMYHDLDYDERTGTYKGQVSLARITDSVMKAAGAERKRGSEEAQTNVKERTAGRVVTSSKTTKEDSSENEMSAGAVIAQRMRNLYK